MSKDTKKENRDQEALVVRLKRGEEEAFQILVGQYKKKIYGIALGITLDQEESLDIVQEVLTKVYEKIHTFKEDSKLSTWIHRITVNHCLNWKRTWKRRFRWRHQSMDQHELGTNESGINKSGINRELGSEEYVPDTLFHSKDLEQRLWKNLGKLPAGTRAVFVLKEFEGLSYDAIAQTLGIKKGTVSSRLYEARRRLREALGPYLEGKAE